MNTANKPMTIYLAGPMSNIEQHNWPAFKAAAAELRAQGHKVISPAEMDIITYGLNPSDPDFSQVNYGKAMKADLIALPTCDAVYVLPGWEESKGAQLEVHIALVFHMPIWDYQTGKELTKVVAFVCVVGETVPWD